MKKFKLIQDTKKDYIRFNKIRMNESYTDMLDDCCNYIAKFLSDYGHYFGDYDHFSKFINSAAEKVWYED